MEDHHPMKYLFTEDLGLWPELRNLDPKFIIEQVERFFIFGDNCCSALLLTKDHRVYAFGEWTEKSSSSTPIEIHDLRGKHIIDVIATDFKLYLVVEISEDNAPFQRNLYSITYNETYSEIKCEVKNVQKYCCYKTKMLALDQADTLWHTANFLCEAPVRSTVPIQENEKIVELACASDVSLLLTNRNRLLLWSPVSIEPITVSQWENISTDKKQKLRIKKLAPFGRNEFLLITTEDLLYHFEYGTNINTTNYLVNQINVDGPIQDVVSTPNGFILVRHDGSCWAWDCYDSRMFQTRQRSIPDVYCLYLHNSTPRLTWISPELLHLSIWDQLGTFNQSSKSDVIFEIKFSNYFISMQRATLMAHSEYFRKKFQDEWLKLDFIFLDDFSYVSWYEYFRYIHTGELRLSILPPEVLMELYEMANKFEDDHLRELIPGQIYDNPASFVS